MISVVIPVFNSEKTIRETMFSALNQTYTGFMEIIVVNDGSTDSSVNMIQEIHKNNKASNREIKLINKSNGGVSSARNLGIKNSTQEWIALLDSDDIWLLEKLELQLKEIEKNPKIKFLGTNRNNEVYPFFFKNKAVYSLNIREILFKWWPSTPTVLIHSSIFRNYGISYDEKASHAEDGRLWIRILKYEKIYVLNKSLVLTGGGKRSYGESGLSLNMEKMYKGEIESLKTAFSDKQIHRYDYIFFYFWLTLKFLRRKAIVRFNI